MEMHQVRYFLAICSERNFTRAARMCHVSQPSLTRAIKLLEAEFGGMLFLREHANSRLTELGEIVRPHLLRVWEQSHGAFVQAREFLTANRSRLRIGVMCTIAPRLLADLLGRVRQRHGAIELQVVDGSAADLEEQLLRRQVTAAIYCPQQPRIDGRLLCIPLFREKMLIAMPSDHRLAGRSSIRLTDLSGEQYVSRTRCEFNETLGRLLRQHGVDCRISFSSDRDDWALALIARGHGVGLVPQHMIDRADVVARPIAEPHLARDVNLVTLRERETGDGLGTLLKEARRSSWTAADERA
jgi:DNA-binding transcriptional LysR family regulator